MAEYIEREAIFKAYMDLCRAKSRLAKANRGAAFFQSDLYPEMEPTTKEVFAMIMAMPAVDVVREKGEWAIREDSYGNELMWCPFCHEEFYDGDNDTVDHTPNFCPNCGADMRKGANG